MLTTSLFFATLFLQTPVADEKLVILATHDLPTPFEARLLSEPVDKNRQEIELKGYVVETEGRFVWIRHRNLYNLAAMDEALDAVSALETIARSGTRFGRFEQLDDSAKAGLRRIMAPLATEFGPLLNSNATQFEIRSHLILKLSDGRKSLQVEVPRYSPEQTPAGFHSQQPSQDEIASYLKNYLPSHSFQPYVDRLMFSFSNAAVQSSVRAEGVERLAKKLRELLGDQANRYLRQYGALESALFSETSDIVEGQTVSSLDDATRKFIYDYLTGDATGNEYGQSLGFDSKLQLRAFLDDARVESVKRHVSVGIGSSAPGQFPRKAFTSVRVNRNPGR
jgi:hypothetical protein